MSKMDSIITSVSNVIFGCSDVGKRVYEFLNENKYSGKICFCDNSSNKIGRDFCGITVLSVEEAVFRCGKDSLFIVASLYHNTQMMRQLLESGIPADRILIDLPDAVIDAQKNAEQQKRLGIREDFRFEVNINKHCNLSCKGCDHFAPVAEPDYLEIEQFEADMRRMSELFEGITYQVHLLGGEPLLNPNIVSFIEISRRHFPKCQIGIATNGILLPKMNDDFWEACRMNNITITPTRYPVKIDYDAIEKMVRNKGVGYEYVGSSEAGRTLWHFPLDLEGKQDEKESFINCRNANQCFTLERGRLFTCSIAPNIPMFNKYFNKNLELTDKDGIDIYKASSAEEILKNMASPMPFCRYCDVKHRTYDHKWEVSKKTIEEWT